MRKTLPLSKPAWIQSVTKKVGRDSKDVVGEIRVDTLENTLFDEGWLSIFNWVRELLMMWGKTLELSLWNKFHIYVDGILSRPVKKIRIPWGKGLAYSLLSYRLSLEEPL